MRLTVAAAIMMFAPLAAFAADAPASTEAAPAASTAAPGARWAACETELKTFCANIEQGKGKKRECLEGHTAELSDGCKARMAAERRKAGR